MGVDSNEFHRSLVDKILDIDIPNHDLQKVKATLAIVDLMPHDIGEALWHAGYHDAREIADYFVETYSDADFHDYLDGQLMAAIDDDNFRKIDELVRQGADLFQNNHIALYEPMAYGRQKMVSYLLGAGLDPARTFSIEDLYELAERVKSGGMDKEDLQRVLSARQASRRLPTLKR